MSVSPLWIISCATNKASDTVKLPIEPDLNVPVPSANKASPLPLKFPLAVTLPVKIWVSETASPNTVPPLIDKLPPAVIPLFTCKVPLAVIFPLDVISPTTFKNAGFWLDALICNDPENEFAAPIVNLSTSDVPFPPYS